jgi:hypothetical protein
MLYIYCAVVYTLIYFISFYWTVVVYAIQDDLATCNLLQEG